MAMLDAKEYSSWMEYFDEKFPGESLIIDRDVAGATPMIRVRSRNIDCETRITIEFPGEDACIVSCYNNESELVANKKQPELLNGIFFEGYYTFNDISLDQLDNQLNIPLHFGWTEELGFYRQKMIEAQVHFNDGVRWNTLPVEKNRSWLDRSGCLLTLFTWPVLYVQHQVVLWMYLRKTREVETKKKLIVAMISPSASYPHGQEEKDIPA